MKFKKLYIFPIVVLSLLVCILGISCSRPADALQKEEVPVGSHIFSREQVINMLHTNGIVLFDFTLTDASYIAPEANWVKNNYSSKLTKFLFDYNLHHWTKESSDCDDISRAGATFGAMLYHNSSKRVNGHGFLFGEYHYVKTGVGGHAINVVIVKDGTNYRLMFYEPQVKYEVTLTQAEKSGSMWLRF